MTSDITTICFSREQISIHSGVSGRCLLKKILEDVHRDSLLEESSSSYTRRINIMDMYAVVLLLLMTTGAPRPDFPGTQRSWFAQLPTLVVSGASAEPPPPKKRWLATCCETRSTPNEKTDPVQGARHAHISMMPLPPLLSARRRAMVASWICAVVVVDDMISPDNSYLTVKMHTRPPPQMNPI